MILLLLCAAPLFADNERASVPWYEPFFVEASAQYYFTPGFFSEVIQPDPGFRGAIGYEFKNFRFALESGLTHITGTNPLVLDISIAPLLLKAGYHLPIKGGLGVQADLSLGFLFSRTEHYDTAINLLLDKPFNTPAHSLCTGARLYAAYTILGDVLKFYAGGGIDLILETSGPIPLPLLEAGISFKPFALAGQVTRRKAEDEQLAATFRR